MRNLKGSWEAAPMKTDRAFQLALNMAKQRDRAIDDPRRPVWLEATDSFYKKLNRIARECQLSRYDALSRGLDALLSETEVRNSALNRSVKSPGQSEVFRRTMGQVSRNYWATVSLEEKRERGRKNAQARWNRRRDSNDEGPLAHRPKLDHRRTSPLKAGTSSSVVI